MFDFKVRWHRMAMCVALGLVFTFVASEGGLMFYFFFGFLAAFAFLNVELDREQTLHDGSIMQTMGERIDLLVKRVDILQEQAEPVNVDCRRTTPPSPTHDP